MDLRVLGPIEVVDDDVAVPIGGPRQRLVLALLVINAGDTVSTDRLVDGVWGDDSPNAARRTVQAYVSNLRKALEAVRQDTLVAHSPGYVLMVDDELVDAARFESAVEHARSLVDTDPTAAASILGEGLALWRGGPYADIAGCAALRPEITRLEELRRNAVEIRIDADLALGRHGQVIGELETLVAEHRLSERFAGQLMVALYRSGRQAEALRVAQRTRNILGEELGIDLSPDLRDLEQSILEHDAALMPSRKESFSVGSRKQLAVVRGFEIRRRIGGSHWAETFVAYQRSLEREVAVRVINPQYAGDPEFMGRFERVISRMIRVTHPNIVPFYDFWRDPDGAYIVRRYFPRGSLANAVEDRSWNPEDTPRLVAQVGSALEAVHRAGFIHRDVKASGIMLDEESNAYITDFAVTRSTFADDRAFLAHLRMEGSHLSDEELLADPTPQTDIRALAAVARLLLAASEASSGSTTVLERAMAPNLADQYKSMGEFVTAFLEASGGTEPSGAAISHNPYKGLRAFDEADRDDFYGRETLIASLLAHLASSIPGCLVLVGASGIGKSSVVNAGLVPALGDGALPGSEHWRVVKMHPGVHPYGELAGALRQVSVGADNQIFGHLTWGDITIGEALKAALDDTLDEIVLIIDQFEQLFTLVRDEHVRSDFINSLVDAIDDPDLHLRLVLALRADFYDRPLEYPKLAGLLNGCTVTMVPMTATELERAISEPAIGVGTELDPGLSGRIAAEVEGQPGTLPLVQYAMTDLFERRNGARITTQDYEASGGVRGPLRTRPEAIYRDLSAEGQQAARQLFLHLVALGEDGQGSRRRVSRSELTSIVGYEHSVRAVIDAFGDARLLSFDRHPVTRTPIVEIAHDALLREWSRLRGWIDDHRADVRLHQRLADATADWISSDRDAEFLLVGGLLHRLSGWSKGTDLALSDIEYLYLQESIEISAAEEHEETKRIRHEHELEDRSRRRLHLLAVVWTLTTLVAILAVFAFAQWQRSEDLAEQAEAVAIADHLAAVAIVEREGDPQLGLLLALRAAEMTTVADGTTTPAAREALLLAVVAAAWKHPLDEPLAPGSLAALIDTARSQLDRRFTADECSTYLGLDTCPIDTIASPIDQ